VIVAAGTLPMAYDDVGTGQPVVFLHGFPLDRRMWAPQTAALAVQARCLTPDLRGLGETPLATPLAPPLSIDQYADDVAALLDALAIDRATVVGLSMGGYVAFALWRRHPERVSAFVLAHTRATADTDEVRDRRRTLIRLARERGSRAVAEVQIEGLVGKTTRRERPEVVEQLGRLVAASPAEGLVGALTAMMTRPDSSPLLATITVPTLVVAGEEDALVPPREARALQEAIPGSRLAVIAGAGHLSNFERPDEFNARLLGFLKGLPDA
jgi:3-oxoadipate enol-lactonase